MQQGAARHGVLQALANDEADLEQPLPQNRVGYTDCERNLRQPKHQRRERKRGKPECLRKKNEHKACQLNSGKQH